MCKSQSKRFSRHHLLIKLSGVPLIMLLCGSVYAQPANDDCGSVPPFFQAQPQLPPLP